MIPLPDPYDDLLYPDTDGRPVAESDFQREPLLYAVSALNRHFRAREQVYVSGNLLIYYERGNPKAAVAPDVFVVLGAPRHRRRTYKLWEEPKAPDFVLEVTSNSTLSEDQGVKRGLYAFLGVAEYWQYDPTGDYLTPALQGLRLVDRNYWPIPVREGADATLIGRSAVLDLELRLAAGTLHFYEPGTGRTLLTYDESEQARELAERGRELAEQRLAATEARLRRLEALLRERGIDPDTRD